MWLSKLFKKGRGVKAPSNDYWSVGIIVKYGYAGSDKYGWWATVSFHTHSRTFHGTMEGKVHTRYACDTLEEAIDLVMEHAKRIGVEFLDDEILRPSVYYRGDGDCSDYPPPAGWREMVNAQSRRLGWQELY